MFAVTPTQDILGPIPLLTMAGTAKSALDELAHWGPHEVRHGDLAVAGMPGVIFTPRNGRDLPVVAFGHGWLQPVRRYHGLLRHLASWGMVVVAPDTQRGALASHRSFATDLRTALDVCINVRLGDGTVTVDAQRLGTVGHAVGGGCAVLAAADDPRVRAVATLAVTETMPSSIDVAGTISAPGLHLAGSEDLLSPRVSNAQPLSDAWGGPVRLRTIQKASHLGFTEGRHWTELLLHGRSEYATRRLSRAMLTAFLLRTLASDDRGEALLDHEFARCSLDVSRGEFTPLTTGKRSRRRRRR